MTTDSATPDTGRASPLRVMVVDDDPDSALIIQHILGVRGGMDVTLVLDPNEALTLAEEQAWDVVVTDVVMPGMTGLDLMTRLRRHWPTLPVVTVTAQIGIAAATYLIDSKADECLLKPIDPLALLQIVARLGMSGRTC